MGESYAIEAARRMDLPGNVLSRAGRFCNIIFIIHLLICFCLDALLDDESRRLIAMQQRLEEETEKARLLQLQFKRDLDDLLLQQMEAEEARKTLDEEVKRLREGFTDKYLKDLKEKERQLELLLRKAEELATYPPSPSADMQTTVPDKNERSKALEKLRLSVKEERIETEIQMISADKNNTIQADPLPNGEVRTFLLICYYLLSPESLLVGQPIEIGTTLIILEKGNLQGCRGTVTQRNKGRGRVVLSIGGIEIKMERHLLGK